ncbi:MAG: GAF domain-containing protein, partial [Calditrichaeota bacterium]
MNPVQQTWFLILLLWGIWGVLRGQAPAPEHRALSSAHQAWVQRMFLTPPMTPLIPEFEDSYGVVFRDLNNDGWPDIYVVRFRDLNRLFLNQGRGLSFRDYTIPSGLGGNLMSRGRENLELGASAVDANNDGRQDVLIVGWGSTTTLYIQQEDLRFTEAYAFGRRHPPLDGNAGVWADVDGDGDLDLFVTDEHHGNHLFIADGFGGFEERSREYGLTEVATSQGAAFADVDGDGDPDLYVCNWFAPDIFYRNDAGRRFVPMDLPLAHLNASLNSNGVTFGDVDNDGDLDFVVTDRTGDTRLYRNDIHPDSSQWRFTDITEEAGIDNIYPAYGSLMADFDNDGWLDIFFTNIGPNQLYLNRLAGDSAKFVLAFEEPSLPARYTRRYSTGAAVADMDHDGDLDLFVANKDTTGMLYPNPLNDGRFLRIRVEGVLSNRDGIGAKVWLFRQIGDSLTPVGYREISGGSGYLSLSEPVAHFGVDPAYTYAVEVRFPSGTTVRRAELRAGREYPVQEMGGIRRAAVRTYQYLSRTVHGRRFLLSLGLFLLLLSMYAGFLTLAIRRYRWQNTQTSLFLIGSFVLLYLVFGLLAEATLPTILMTQIATLAALMAIIAGFMEKIHRLEIKRAGDRRLLEEFSRQIILIKENRELYRQMVTAIHRAMKVRFCLLLEVQGEKAHLQAVAGEWPGEKQPPALPEGLQKELRHRSLLRRPAVKEHLPALAAQGVVLVIPLRRAEKLFAVLLLGARTDGRDFLPEDLGLLQILAGQAAIAIENNLYIEETRQLVQKLTEAEIREKYVKELEEKNRKLEQLYRELKETQMQLIQSEKMASLGQLVAGIAHELNNPISYIYANMKELQRYTEAITELLNLLTNGANSGQFQETLQARLKELDERYDLGFIQQDMRHLIQETLEGNRRVKEVVQNLRNFSRLDEAEFKAVDIHEGLESTLVLLNNEIKNRIRIHKEYGDIPPVPCNPGQLNQGFMSLLRNVIQAIEGPGDIWIITRREGDSVEITIRDNGKGIPEEVQGKIFDPFFTT